MFESYEEILRSLARKLCADSEDAHDLVQDTFERALRFSDRLDPRNVRAWLLTIMRNLYFDRLRRQSRRPSLEPIEHALDVPVPEPDVEPDWATVGTDDLRAAMACLDERYRRVYELHCFSNVSYEEIARTLSIPKATVGTRLARARQKIREILLSDLARARSRRLDHDYAM